MLVVGVRQRVMPLLGTRQGFMATSLIMTVLGSATTIVAPIVLKPADFAQFALLSAMFMYTTDFDLGLSRLADRVLHSAHFPYTFSDLVVARLTLCVGVSALMFAIGCCFGGAMAIAGLAGVMFMAANGPLSYYRARSEVYALTIVGVATGFGLVLPRLVGLLVDGARGAMVALLLWSAVVAVWLYRPFLPSLRSLKSRPAIFRDSVPLFVFQYFWLIYLLSNRWFSGSLSSPTDTGLFAFGATLLFIGVGAIERFAQVYYPRRLAGKSSQSLSAELMWLSLVVLCGVMIGIVFCRAVMPHLFSKYAAASQCSAAMLLSGLPLCMATWVLPMVIARSDRPWIEATVIAGVGLVSLYVGMWIGSRYGVVGQSVGCLPSAGIVLGIQMILLVRAKLIDVRGALLCGASICVEVLCSGVAVYVA